LEGHPTKIEEGPLADDVRVGSFAAGPSQREVRPCPLCPDSDQIPQRSEMTLCADFVAKVGDNRSMSFGDR
jgi:hypothetical protein